MTVRDRRRLEEVADMAYSSREQSLSPTLVHETQASSILLSSLGRTMCSNVESLE